MYNAPNINHARNHYKTLELSSKLESASAHGLVSILYDEMLRSLDVMAVVLKNGRPLAQEKHADRARSILIALSASLDFEKGGTVAETLAGVYRAMSIQLEAIIKGNDEARLAELRIGLLSIVTAWNKII